MTRPPAASISPFAIAVAYGHYVRHFAERLSLDLTGGAPVGVEEFFAHEFADWRDAGDVPPKSDAEVQVLRTLLGGDDSRCARALAAFDGAVQEAGEDAPAALPLSLVAFVATWCVADHRGEADGDAARGAGPGGVGRSLALVP